MVLVYVPNHFRRAYGMGGIYCLARVPPAGGALPQKFHCSALSLATVHILSYSGIGPPYLYTFVVKLYQAVRH